MEQDKNINEPDNTAVRTALWRAVHLQVDEKPYIIEDEVGLRLVAPEEGWQQRPDIKYSKRLRASILARARFIEDLITEESKLGISQYVILGAGLDTFTQRRPEIASNLQIFEIDKPETLNWKREKLIEYGFGIPDYLHFVPLDFETSLWWDNLLKAGFDLSVPAFVACTGVSLYLTREAIISTLKQISKLTPGSKLAMTFYLTMEFLDEEDKHMAEIAEKSARAAGTPFVSFFSPEGILDLVRETDFKEAKTITTKELEQLYFANRTDNLIPSSGEVFLVAAT